MILIKFMNIYNKNNESETQCIQVTAGFLCYIFTEIHYYVESGIQKEIKYNGFWCVFLIWFSPC